MPSLYVAPSDLEIAADPYSNKDWKDRFGRGYEHPGYEPTPRQIVIIEAVKQARVVEKLIYTDEILKSVAKTLMVEDDHPGIAIFPTEVYKATLYAKAQEVFLKRKALAQALRLQEGDALGTLVPNDGRRLTSVRVLKVDDSGLTISIAGNRGPCAQHGRLGVLSIADAISEAHRKGARKQDLASFIASRSHLPQVVVVADPREPFYKTFEQHAGDKEQAMSMRSEANSLRIKSESRLLEPDCEALEQAVCQAMLAKSIVLTEKAGLLAMSVTGGAEVDAQKVVIERAQLNLASQEDYRNTRFPNWEEGMAELESHRRLQLAQANQAAPEPEVVVLGESAQQHFQTIINSINVLALQRNDKYIAERVRKGYMTPDRAREMRADAERAWATDRKLDESTTRRTSMLARAIADQDPRLLVQMWGIPGRGVTGSEGSIRAFTEITGVSIFRLSASDRARALYTWAQWTPKQINAHQQELALAAARQQEIHQAKELETQRRDAVAAAVRHTLNTPEGLVTVKQFVDDLVTKGYDTLAKQRVGNATKTLLCDVAAGRGFVMPCKEAIEYAKHAKHATEYAKHATEYAKNATAAAEKPKEQGEPQAQDPVGDAGVPLVEDEKG